MLIANARVPAGIARTLALGALALAFDVTAQSESGSTAPGAARIQQQLSVAEERAAALEQTLEGLRADLILLAAQVPAWESYAGKVRDLERGVPPAQSAIAATPAAKGSQQSDAQLAAVRSREAALGDVSRAATALLAVLVPEQRWMASARVASMFPSR